jgi:hypothetical protein
MRSGRGLVNVEFAAHVGGQDVICVEAAEHHATPIAQPTSVRDRDSEQLLLVEGHGMPRATNNSARHVPAGRTEPNQRARLSRHRNCHLAGAFKLRGDGDWRASFHQSNGVTDSFCPKLVEVPLVPDARGNPGHLSLSSRTRDGGSDDKQHHSRKQGDQEPTHGSMIYPGPANWNDPPRLDEACYAA